MLSRNNRDIYQALERSKELLLVRVIVFKLTH